MSQEDAARYLVSVADHVDQRYLINDALTSVRDGLGVLVQVGESAQLHWAPAFNEITQMLEEISQKMGLLYQQINNAAMRVTDGQSMF